MTAVLHYYQSSDQLLVFPAEVTAAAWRRQVARSLPGRVARADRIVSWDVFKEMAVPVKRHRRPASRLARRAFALGMLRDNAESPFLTTVIEPTFAPLGEASAAAVSQMLPQLPALIARKEALRPSLAQDFAAIMERYRWFLDQHGLFEPDWELARTVDLSHLPRRPRLFWPELLEDYEEYRPLLGDQVDTVPLPTDPREAVQRYATERDEVSAVCDRIEAALSAGQSASRLAVTAADIDSLMPRLAEETARRGIPLRRALGQAVVDQPGGRLFARINEVLEADFSVEALAGLLLDRGVPWRDAGLNQLLVRFGYATHCYRRDRWDAAFSLATEYFAGEPERNELPVLPAQLPAIQGRWKVLSAGLNRLRGARSAAELRTALRDFLSRHLQPAGHEAWSVGDGTAERVYETALTELDAVVSLEKRGISVPAPWAFFLEALRERQYVPRQHSGAVAVYPYRVAAGIPADLHCVAGLSQSATRVRSTPPLAVRHDEAQAMGWTVRDRSGAFLRAYGTLVEGTVLSVADQGGRGAQVPAAELGGTAGDAQHAAGTLWDREQTWWHRQSAPPPEQLYQPQWAGLQRALTTTLVPAGTDYRFEPLPVALREELRELHHLSPASVDRYLSCPFSFLITGLLPVRHRDFGFTPEQNRLRGIAWHHILAGAFSLPESRRRGALAALVEAAYAEPLVALTVAPVGIAADKEYAVEAIAALLDSSALEPHRPGRREEALTATIGRVVVKGITDRIVGLDDDGPLVVVDYKINLHGRHSANRVFGSSQGDPGTSETLQLPMYAALAAEQTGRPVERLVYVGLEKAEVKVIADAAGTGNQKKGYQKLQDTLESLPAFLEEMWEAVRSGRLLCDPEPDCSGCRIRSICRSCFVTRRYRDG